ncbi:MAG: endonuclease domain-containing protein [Alphaproteobacteria bacterium]
MNSQSNVMQLFDGKKCGACKEEKSLSEFQHNIGRHGKFGISKNCQSCRQEKKKATWKAKRDSGVPFLIENDGRSKVVLTENGRVCLVCNVGKSWNEFSNDAHGYNGKFAKCRECVRATRKPDLRGHGLKDRPNLAMRKYGVTWEYLVRTLQAQHGRCANKACDKEISLDVPNGRDRANADHCHKTGKFRALLCNSCNLLLGRIENHQHIIDGLMDYAFKHRTGE